MANEKPGKTASRRRTGASRRSTQRRIGQAAAVVPEDFSTPAKAQSSLYELGRTALVRGHVLRVEAEVDTAAFDDIQEVCREEAAGLKERGVSPNMVAGAAAISRRLEALLDGAPPTDEGTPASEVVASAAAFAKVRREAILRVLPGAENATARKKFGIHVPMTPNSSVSVRKACEALIRGKRATKTGPAAALITPNDVKTLRQHVKAIKAEKKDAAHRQREVTKTVSERDILTAALEVFYDRFAGAIGLVLEENGLARANALQLVPRAERRKAPERKSPAPGGGQGGPAEKPQ